MHPYLLTHPLFRISISTTHYNLSDNSTANFAFIFMHSHYYFAPEEHFQSYQKMKNQFYYLMPKALNFITMKSNNILSFYPLTAVIAI